MSDSYDMGKVESSSFRRLCCTAAKTTPRRLWSPLGAGARETPPPQCSTASAGAWSALPDSADRLMSAFKIRLIDSCRRSRFGWSTHVCIQDSADRLMSAFKIRLIDSCLHSRFGWSTHVCIQDSADRRMSAFKIRLIDSCPHSGFDWSTHVCARFGWSTHVCIASRPFWWGFRSGVGRIRIFGTMIISSSRICAMPWLLCRVTDHSMGIPILVGFMALIGQEYNLIFQRVFSTGTSCPVLRIRIRIHWSEVWTRIRILLWIRILLSSSKNCKKNLDSYFFLTLFDFLSLKNDVNLASKSNKQKNCIKK